MNKTVKRILIAVVALLVLVGVGTVVYVYVWDQADEEFDQGDVEDRLDATVPTGSGDSVAASDGVDGEWVIAADSEVGYRVEEVINGLDKTANGRTKDVTGSIVIDGTTATSGEFTVDMTTVSTDQSRGAAMRSRPSSARR